MTISTSRVSTSRTALPATALPAAAMPTSAPPTSALPAPALSVSAAPLYEPHWPHQPAIGNAGRAAQTRTAWLSCRPKSGGVRSKAHQRKYDARLRLCDLGHEHAHSVPEAPPFVELTMRAVLEVLDLRRAPEQLRTMLSAAAVDAVRGHIARSPRPEQIGQLTRVHYQNLPGQIEFFGCYHRGQRAYAFAGRAEHRSAGRQPRWRVSALQLG